MSLQESGEMYLETIHVLSKKTAIVRAVDIGEELGYSRPSVSRAMHILKDEGFITTHITVLHHRILIETGFTEF